MKELVKNWKFWLIALIGVVVVGFGVWGLTQLLKTTPVPNVPQNLQVVEATNGKTYLFVDTVENAKMYEFVIENTETKNVETRQVAQNQFDATLFFYEPATYTIMCLAINDSEKSGYCEKITFVKQTKLSTPVVTVDKSTNKLSVMCDNALNENVDLIFSLFYVDGTEQKVSTDFEIDMQDGQGTVWGTFDVESIIGKTGSFQVMVQVSANNKHFKASDFSAIVEVVIE